MRRVIPQKSSRPKIEEIFFECARKVWNNAERNKHSQAEKTVVEMKKEHSNHIFVLSFSISNLTKKPNNLFFFDLIDEKFWRQGRVRHDENSEEDRGQEVRLKISLGAILIVLPKCWLFRYATEKTKARNIWKNEWALGTIFEWIRCLFASLLVPHISLENNGAGSRILTQDYKLT